jgi:thioredoxin-like negative regulator of GroEL
MTKIQAITSIEDLNKIITNNKIVLCYFSTVSCSVGEALEPKVKSLINTDFPKIHIFHVDIHSSPEIIAKFSVYVEPTILVFFYGKETIRKSRNVGIYELREAIEKRYKLIYE